MSGVAGRSPRAHAAAQYRAVREARDALAAAEAKLAVIQPLLFGPESAEYYHGKHCYIGAPECFTCLRFDEVRAALSGGQQDG